MKTSLTYLALALAAQGIVARDVPSNVRSFYNRVKSGGCTGSDLLKSGFHDTDDSSASKGLDLIYRVYSLADHGILVQNGPTVRKT